MDEFTTINSIEKHLRPEYHKKQKKLQYSYVGLAPQSYFSLLKFIDDDYLTEWEVMKLRVTFKEIYRTSFVYPVLTYGVFWVAFPKLFGVFVLRSQYMRSFRWAVCLAQTVMVWSLVNSFPFANRTFHEVLTQPEPNGQYMRRVFRDTLPRQWGLVSKSLHEQGYNFREMYEYHEAEVMPEATNKFDNTLY